MKRSQRQLIAASFLTLLQGLYGCSSASENTKASTLRELAPFRIAAEIIVENEKPTSFTASILPADGLYKAPRCPLVQDLTGKLNEISLDADPGGADSQRDLNGNEKVVCQPPGISASKSDLASLESGAHVINLSDGTATARLTANLRYENPVVEITAPSDGRLRVGGSVTLRTTPGVKATTNTLVSFRGSDGLVAFTRSGSDLQWSGEDTISFTVPTTASPAPGVLELMVDAWDQPRASQCEGATTCTVQLKRVGGPAFASVAAQLQP